MKNSTKTNEWSPNREKNKPNREKNKPNREKKWRNRVNNTNLPKKVGDAPKKTEQNNPIRTFLKKYF